MFAFARAALRARRAAAAAPRPRLRRGFLTWNTSVYNVHKWTNNEPVSEWLVDRIRMLQPSSVHLCDGSDKENELLLSLMVQTGQLLKLNPKLRPNSYLARSTVNDVARVEERTFICTETATDAGPMNNWKDPEQTQKEMIKLFTGAMRGRTMYVVPFVMGPPGSPFTKLGIQLTDSPYVVVNMRIMTRMGESALKLLGDTGNFIPCVHSVGAPVEEGKPDSAWPCNPDHDKKWIVHFPEQRRIWSYGSGYGGNALLGKKCYALRIASYMAREEGWLAEHMLIVGITNPQGKKKYICGAFPSACGKTNLAMMNPKLPGWKIECVGDDIAWMRIGKDGRLWAVNPEAGFFGVAPGTSRKSNPNALDMLKRNVIFTNCAVLPNGDVWWEDMTDKPPKKATSWLRTEWTPSSMFDAAHPNARFTVPARQCPVIDPNWESPEGVPISAIIFGGRRSSTVPLVYQAFNWRHGVFVGATLNSETTAAAAGARGVLRADPFAMRPFCGYNMGDYFAHWLTFTEKTDPKKLPKIFHVNWFRKSAAGKYIWPGYGDNTRVIKWIFDRCDMNENDHSNAVESAIGILPGPNALDLSGLDIADKDIQELFRVGETDWQTETIRNMQFLRGFQDHLPSALEDEAIELMNRLNPPKEIKEKMRRSPKTSESASATATTKATTTAGATATAAAGAAAGGR